MTASTFSPSSTACTISSCPGRKPPKPKTECSRSRAVESEADMIRSQGKGHKVTGADSKVTPTALGTTDATDAGQTLQMVVMSLPKRCRASAPFRQLNHAPTGPCPPQLSWSVL